MPDAPKRRNLFQFMLLFAVIYLATQFVLRIFFPSQFGGSQPQTGILLRPVDASITIGHHPELVLENRTQAPLMIPSRCPSPPFDLFSMENPGTPQEKATPITSTEAVTGCEPTPTIPPGEEAKLSLAPWKYALFERVGTFEARLPSDVTSPAATGTGTALAPVSTRFTISEPGVITKLFRTFITAPFLNALIFIASLIPSHDLGFAIIILTLLVKILLFLPTKHALEGQKKMQLLQPKLEALKHQYGSDQKKMQEETMKLWKEHKINPFSACLPTLLQLPILIGLFYVIRDGSHLEVSRHLIYPAYQDLPWGFDTFFLGLDLLKPSVYIMPPLLVVLQYLQMKLSFAINARKKAKSESAKIIDVPQKNDKQDGKEAKKPASPQDMQQKIMTYGLPLMIGFFAFQFPAAVSIYWGISTLFSIGQQILVNREHLTVRT